MGSSESTTDVCLCCCLQAHNQSGPLGQDVCLGQTVYSVTLTLEHSGHELVMLSDICRVGAAPIHHLHAQDESDLSCYQVLKTKDTTVQMQAATPSKDEHGFAGD